MTEEAKTNLIDLLPQELMQVIDAKSFSANQIFRWIHKKGARTFTEMTDLSKPLRLDLSNRFVAGSLRTELTLHSKSSPGTKKMLFRLSDDETIESVLIREGTRTTLCLSTQVGCAIRCTFCATGTAGFKRNLTPGEIVEQAYLLLADEDLDGRTPNIVYMGMGEPFRNYDALMKSVRLLMNRQGLGIGARKITVSTSGEVLGIKRFMNDGGQLRLSVSLHAANDELRSELVPLNRKYPLAELMEALQEYQVATGRHVTFEWILLEGINDSMADAHELASLVSRFQSTVNLIPWNPFEGISYAPSSLQQARKFRAWLESKGVNSTLRTERGKDIQGACGQLRAK